MEKILLNKICQLIYQKYPIITGQTPVVSKQGADRYLLIFLASGQTPDGITIQHRVRVVATEDGRILKTSMSR